MVPPDMKKLITPFRVGIFVLASVFAFIGFYSFVHKGGLSRSDALEVFGHLPRRRRSREEDPGPDRRHPRG